MVKIYSPTAKESERDLGFMIFSPWRGLASRSTLFSRIEGVLKAFWWILVEALECLSPSNFHL